MKCSSIKLINRKDYTIKTTKNNQKTDHSNKFFVTNAGNGHSIAFYNKIVRGNSTPNLSVKNIDFPENFCSFNTGSSLDKWSKKKPRLKSGKSDNNKYNFNYNIFNEYDISFDIEDLLNNLEKDDVEKDEDNISTSNLEYELHSDIEELFLKSQREEDEKLSVVEERSKEKTKKRKSSKDKTDEDKSKKKVKHKLKKTIKFSLSKPASPETEQVIRVDVTSNVSVEDFQHMGTFKNVLSVADCSKGHAKKIINASREELRRNYIENRNENNEGDEDEDFIIRCKKLALNTKNFF